MKSFSKIYKFYDTDITGLKEYNIIGEDYKNLIKMCCKYCTTLSLIATNANSHLLKELEIYEIEKSEKISFNFNHYGEISDKIKYYSVSPELYRTIIKNTNDIFCWINGWNFENPEDPTFYREDGSVFFTSTIHEGTCTLFVKGEDVSKIVNNSNWVEETGDGSRNTGDGSLC